MKKLLQIALCVSVILPTMGFSYSSANRNIQYPKAIFLYETQDGGGGVYTSSWHAYPLHRHQNDVTVAVEAGGKQTGWTIFSIDCANVSNSYVVATNNGESYLSINDYASMYSQQIVVNKVLQKFCR